MSLVVKDVNKGESMSNKRNTNNRKILVDLIVPTLGQKKERKSSERSWKWKGTSQEEGEGSKEIHLNLWQHKDIQNADDLSR